MGFHTGEIVKVNRPSGEKIGTIVAIDGATYPYTVEFADPDVWSIRVDEHEIRPLTEAEAHEGHGGASGSFRSEGCDLCPEDESHPYVDQPVDPSWTPAKAVESMEYVRDLRPSKVQRESEADLLLDQARDLRAAAKGISFAVDTSETARVVARLMEIAEEKESEAIYIRNS